MRALLCTALLSNLLPLAAQSANHSANHSAGHEPPPTIETIEMSLRDAVDAYFENNTDLDIARLDTEATFAAYGATWGAFDTTFFVSSTRSESISAPSPANFVNGVPVGASPIVEADFWTLNAGLRGQLTTGSTWEVSAGPSWLRTASSFGAPVVNTGTADFSVTHPFLRGGADDYARRALELAAKNVRLAEADFDVEAFVGLQDVILNYWNLVFANSDVKTKELSVRLAEELLGITQRKFEQGLQNRIEVIEVEAEVAKRHEELLTARNAAEQAVDGLRGRIGALNELEAWRVRIVPTTTYDDIPDDDVDEETALENALRLRPDMKRARLDLDRAELEVRRAETQALPRLDATAGYGINSNERSVGLALTRLDDSNFHQARLTVDFEMPLVNRSNGFIARQRRIQRDRAALVLLQAEITAISEVRDAVRNVRLEEARIITTAEEARLRGEAYEGEQRRLENDLSTPFKVRESQRDYLLALDAETRAKLDLANARSILAAVQGTIYEAFDYVPESRTIDLDQAPDLP